MEVELLGGWEPKFCIHPSCFWCIGKSEVCRYVFSAIYGSFHIPLHSGTFHHQPIALSTTETMEKWKLEEMHLESN